MKPNFFVTKLHSMSTSPQKLYSLIKNHKNNGPIVHIVSYINIPDRNLAVDNKVFCPPHNIKNLF